MIYECLHRQSVLFVLLVCGVVWSMAAHSKMTIVTLPQLVKKSEVIVYGHISPSLQGASNQLSATVQFEAESILKGHDAAAVRIIAICNQRDEYSDEYDVAKLTGNFVLFLSKKGQCYELSHGDRSVVAVKGDRAVTIAIEDQPDDQPLSLFFGKLRGLSKESQSQRHATLAALASDFAKARALPPGSRPAPPGLNLEDLVGLSLSQIRSALGSPDKPIEGYGFECGAERCFAFTYGPTGHEEPTEIKQADGLETVVVTTGGPFLLVVGVSSKEVITARWQGQK
jgi:hypothetical protein